MLYIQIWYKSLTNRPSESTFSKTSWFYLSIILPLHPVANSSSTRFGKPCNCSQHYISEVPLANALCFMLVAGRKEKNYLRCLAITCSESSAMPPAKTPINVQGRHSPVSLGTNSWSGAFKSSISALILIRTSFFLGKLLAHFGLAMNVLLRFLFGLGSSI